MSCCVYVLEFVEDDTIRMSSVFIGFYLYCVNVLSFFSLDKMPSKIGAKWMWCIFGEFAHCLLCGPIFISSSVFVYEYLKDYSPSIMQHRHTVVFLAFCGCSWAVSHDIRVQCLCKYRKRCQHQNDMSSNIYLSCQHLEFFLLLCLPTSSSPPFSLLATDSNLCHFLSIFHALLWTFYALALNFYLYSKVGCSVLFYFVSLFSEWLFQMKILTST